MSSARKPSGLLKTEYDKIVLLLILVILLGSAVWLAIQAKQAGKGIDPSELAAVNPAPVLTLDTTPLDALSDTFNRPFQIPAAQRRMLVGELRVSSIPDGLPIPFDAALCPHTGAKQPTIMSAEERDSDGDGLPDVWETKFGFNPLDPSDATADADNDGFSNLEEFQSRTDPTDPESFPPPSAKLRLIRVLVNPFKLRFLGTSRLPNGDVVYQLNLRTLERTYFPRMNDEVEGFKIVGYQEKAADGPTLVLQQGDKSINLVQGRVRDEQAYTALMIFLVDGSRFRANIGENVTLLEQVYKVVDIKQDTVLIREEKSGNDVEIGLISDEERRALTAGGKTGGGL